VSVRVFLERFVRWFFQPWGHKVLFSSNPLLRSVLVGVLASLSIFATARTLFSSTNDLRGRSVASVFISPDEQIVKAREESWTITGQCFSQAFGQPPEQRHSLVGQSKVCRNWKNVDPYNRFSGWEATEYLYQSGSPEIKFGNSRQDALESVWGRWFEVAKHLMIYLGVFLGLQAGIAVGFSYFQRNRPQPN
jgi:hypothetical protein